jgi:predicted ATPase
MGISDPVRATVLGRLRLLNRAERAVVMHASVIGCRFGVALLTATSMCGEARVRAAIERACTLQLVVADEPRSERYAFRHALVRDVVYGELIAERVRPIHRRIARALERAARTIDVIDGLAFHSWAAGDARRCLRYNELAGDRAAAVFAKDDARTYYIRARGAIPIDSDAYARLTMKLGVIAKGEQAAERRHLDAKG